MKVTKVISTQLGPALVSISTLLAAWNWYLRPERAMFWAATMVLLACMMVALRVANRRSLNEETRHAARSIQSAVEFSGVVLALTLGARVANSLGVWGDVDLARRGTMVILGVFLVLAGNAMPKTLTPLAALRCDAAKVQAFQRFAGWVWVLAGLAYATVWLLLPVEVARPASIGLLVSVMLAILLQIVRLRMSRPKEA